MRTCAEAADDAALPARAERAGTRPIVRAWAALAGVVAVVALAYSSGLSGGFVWDDHLLIDEQPFTHEIRPLSTYFGRYFWSDPAEPDSRSFYRPLTSLSYALEWQAWEGDATGFHVTNLLLHLACCALVFGLARRAGASVPAAAAGAALFGTFPRLTESVAWISGRTDVAAGLGGLGALLLHRSAPGHGPRRAAAGLSLLAGLLFKEVALAAALGIAALELAKARGGGRPARALAARLAPTAGALVTYGLLRAAAAAPAPGATQGFAFDPVRNLVELPLQALGHYTLMLLQPLSPRARIGTVGVVEPGLVAVGAVAAVGLLGLAAATWRRGTPWSCALLALGVGALLPVLHVIPLTLTVVAADRFLYLPAAALAAAGAAAATRLPRRAAGAALAGALAVVAAFALVVHERAPLWGDDYRLWREAAAHAPPGNSLAHSNLGDTLAWRGQPEAAIRQYEKALRIRDAHPLKEAWHPQLVRNLGLVLSEAGRYEEARALLERLVARHPRVAAYRLSLGAVQARMLDFDAAEASLTSALDLVEELPLARRLRDQVRRARALWRRLPPPAPRESLELRAARATVYALVGRMRDADRLWAEIASAPEVPPPLLRRAARHLARRGFDQEAAERALQRLEETGGSSLASRLAHALDERGLARGAGAPAGPRSASP